VADEAGDLTGGPGPDRFERWLAALRIDEAARARVRRRWLRHAAEEDATLAGVLLDLAERQAPVSLVTSGGRRHHGPVVVVGEDFAGLRTGIDRHVLVRLDHVVSVRPIDEDAAPIGDRDVASSLRLLDVLIGLAGDRLDAWLLLSSGDQVAGSLRSVGRDVVVVRADGGSGTTTYVNLEAVVEVAQEGPPLSP
jgi:hypothetical protein